MSRIRRISYAITPEGHRTNAIKQAVDLRDKVLSIVDDSNFSTSTARKITKKAAFSVVMRSLEESKGLPLSLREHLAMKELNNYIALAKHNKSDFFYATNTDLLPISHPRSTREHSMTASALRISRSRWFAADPRITDERAKAVLASAFESIPGSVEHLYYSSILLSLPQGVIPGDALIAASDGNSSESRSARARRQRRDSKGRFAFEGGGIRALIRRLNGEIFSISGRVVANAKNSRDVEVEFPDGKIAQVNPVKGEYIKAVLPTPDGYSPKPIVPSASDEVINEKELVFLDAPNGWVKDKSYKDFGDRIERYVDSNKEFVVYVSKKDDGTKDYQILNAKSAEQIDVVDTWADVQDRLEGKEDQILNQKAELPKQQVAPVETKGGFEYNYPDNAYKIRPDLEYDIQGRVDEESPDFTDDPVELAQKQDERDLLAALEQAVSPGEDGENALGVGALPFNKGDEFVPAEAIFFALQEAGADAPMELAKIYDKKLGDNVNEKALNDFRKKEEVVSGNIPELAESFKKVTEQNPDLEPPTKEPKFDAKEAESAPLPALLEGLSQKELDQFIETKDHIPYLPKNEEIEMPEGYNPLSPEPFAAWKEVTAENPDAILPEGFSDNPVYLAQEIPTNDLLKELRRSVEPGNEVPGAAVIALPTEDGEDFVANVPGEAVRDALQLKGVDTNAELKKIADEGFVGQKDEPIAELPAAATGKEIYERRIATGDSLDKVAKDLGIPREEVRRLEAEYARTLDKAPNEPQADLPSDLLVEKKPMNAYDRLMAENLAAAEAVEERVAKLNKDAQDRVDEQGRSVPEGWGVTAKNRPSFGRLDIPDNYFNVYGNNNFEASVDADGKITVKDRNGLLPDKSYDNWEDLQADLENQKSEYSSAARERVREIAKKYGYSDDQIAAFDSMSQQELADFFANPENHTKAYAEALDDLANSSAVDLPSPAQKQRWAQMRKDEKILAQAGDALSEKAPDEAVPGVEKPADGLPLTGEILNGKVKYSIGDKKQTNDVTYRILNLKGDTSSLTEKINKLKSRNFIVTGEDGGDLQIQVQRDKKRFPAPGNVKEDIDDILKQFDAPAEKAAFVEDYKPTADQIDKLKKGIAELDWLNEGILFAKRDGGDDRLPAQDGVIDIYDDNAVAGDLPIGTIDADNNLEWRDEETKKRYEVLVKGILDEDLEGIVQNNFEPPVQEEAVVAIDVNSPNLQEEIQSAIDKGQKIAFSYNGKNRSVLPKSIWTNPKNGNVNLRAIEDGPDGGQKVFTLDKMEMAEGSITPPPVETKPKELSEGDKAVIKNNAFVEENAGTLQPTEARNLKIGDFLWAPFFGRYEEILAMEPADLGRIKFTVFNVYNNKEETRYFEMESPLRNVRRPGIEDQAEPIPSAKAAPRGGKRGLIKRAPLSDQVRAKEGRPIAMQKEEEGLFKDKNGVAVKPGDVVIHPKHPEWGRGVVKLRIGAQVREGKKAGGQVRAGKVQPNKLVVQFEGDTPEWVLKNAGRELKAGNIELFEGNYDDLVLDPRFRGGAMIPNAPANPAAPAEPRRFPPTTGERQAIERPVAPAKPAAPAAPDAIADDKFAVPLMEPVGRKDKSKEKDLENQIRRAIDAGDEISFNYNGKTRYVKPVRVWENPQNGNINITAIENGEIKNFTIGKMDYIKDPEGAPIERPKAEKFEPLNVVFELDNDNIKNGLEEVRKGIKKLKGGKAVTLRNAEAAIDSFVAELDVKDHRGIKISDLDALLRRLERLGGADDLIAAVQQLKNIVEPEKQRLELDFERKMFDEINNPLEAVVADAKTINAANVKEVIDEIVKRLPDDGDGAAYRLSIVRRHLLSYAKDISTDDDIVDADISSITEAISYLEGLPVDVSGIKKQLEELKKSVKGYAKNNKKPFGKANMPFIDPIALQEKRAADGVNKFDLANAKNLKSLIADDQVFADNPFAAPYKEELQNFFAQDGEVSLAALSVDARQALSQLVGSEIRKLGAGSTDAKKVRANEYARMIMGLHDEKLAFNPNRDNLGPVGEQLKDIDFAAVFKAGQKLRTDKPVELEINGQPTEFRIQRVGDGINASYNYRLIDKTSGQIFYFKRERTLETADAEYASNQLARALNIAGVPVVVKHNNGAQVLIMTNAGDSLEFEKDPTIAGNSGQDYADVAARAAVADLIAFGILDAVIANSDRHTHNFLLGSVDRGNVDRNGREEIQILPIDHGFAQLFQSGRVNDPLDYMTGGDGRDGGRINKAFAKDIGAAAYKELIDMTIQQAIQAIERGDYLSDVKPANKQAIIDRLLVLKGIDVDKWKSNLAKKL